MSQVVLFKSRECAFTLNFPTTENQLSWPFIPENDGEIFEVTLNNVATYTINGSEPTFPYAVTMGTSYSIAITKITNGQAAIITFKTRRAVNKTVTLNAIDTNQYNGRYYYALMSNNVLAKLDPDLLVASNYQGAGVWTTNPIVASVTLPTLSLNQWQGMHFCNGKILVAAIKGKDGNTCSFCYVDPESLVYTNLDSVPNQVTDIINNTITVGIASMAYNSIDNIAIVNNSYLDLTNKSLSIASQGVIRDLAIDKNTYCKLLSFNQANKTFASVGDIHTSDDYALNFKAGSSHFNSMSAGFAYNPLLNQTVSRYGARLRFYDYLGKLVVDRVFYENDGTLYNTKWLAGTKYLAYSQTSSRRVYFSNPSAYTLIDYATINGYETNMFFIDVAISNYKQTLILRNNLATSKRLFVFDSSTEAYIGYLDLPEHPISICSSQNV